MLLDSLTNSVTMNIGSLVLEAATIITFYQAYVEYIFEARCKYRRHKPICRYNDSTKSSLINLIISAIEFT